MLKNVEDKLNPVNIMLEKIKNRKRGFEKRHYHYKKRQRQSKTNISTRGLHAKGVVVPEVCSKIGAHFSSRL